MVYHDMLEGIIAAVLMLLFLGCVLLTSLFLYYIYMIFIDMVDSYFCIYIYGRCLMYKSRLMGENLWEQDRWIKICQKLYGF